MKKLLFLLYTITFITVSFLSIKQFEYLQFQSFNFRDEETTDQWIVEVEAGNSSLNRLENFELLINSAEQANANLQRVAYELTPNKSNKTVYYVALSDYESYFNDIELVSGKFLDKTSRDDDFLSTTLTSQENQIGQIEIFKSFDPIEIRPLIAAEKTRNINGTYTIIGSVNIENFNNIVKKNGFEFKTYKDTSYSIFARYPYQNMMYITSLVLCLLILLALNYDVMNDYKAVSVRLLLGNSFAEIGYYIFKRYIFLIVASFCFTTISLVTFLYFYNQYQQFWDFLIFWIQNIGGIVLILFLILILAWFSTISINIVQMIKNRKPLKMYFYLNLVVRLFISVFLLLGLVQGINTYFELQKTQQQNKQWELLKNYSLLGITSGNTPNLSENKTLGLRFSEMYRRLEEQGAIYINPSNYYLSDVKDLNPDPWGMEGKQVAINKNYLTVNPIYDYLNKKVDLPKPNKNVLTVLVPVKNKNFEADIIKTIKKDYAYMLNSSRPDLVDVNIIYVKNNQKYFTFSTQMAAESNYSIVDPNAIVTTYEFEPAFTSSMLAMGYGYYSKNNVGEFPLKQTSETIRSYGFDGIWEPISVAYSTVESKMANQAENVKLSSVYSMLFIILMTVLLIFSGINYLEMNKKTLALQRIFGYSFIAKHYLVYLLLIAFWQVSFLLCFFLTDNTKLLIKVTMGLVILDFLVITILILRKEIKVIKQTLLEK